MQKLVEKSARKVRDVSLVFKRSLLEKINWDDRLIILEGARGVGKTTLLLQHMKETFGSDEHALYVSLDDLWFANNALSNLAEEFVKYGGLALYIDEVHKYPDWMREVKNIYDDYPELQIILTGSSSIHLGESKADLSRRAITYHLPELSLREFISLSGSDHYPVFSLGEIVSNHHSIASELTASMKPLMHLKDYLRNGAYPFVFESPDTFAMRLETVIMTVLETDLPAVLNLDYTSVQSLKKLLYVLSTSAPFKPNISSISSRTGIARDTLLRYLSYLEQANLIMLLKSNNKGMSYLTKPDKIYIRNTNLMNALSPENINSGTMRETFFLNQVRIVSDVYHHKTADFEVGGTYVFEVGGKNKSRKQLEGNDHGYIVSDDLEIGYRNKIPLWLFGFLY